MLLLSFQLHYHLHSTVVLLKAGESVEKIPAGMDLHSTVVLLKALCVVQRLIYIRYLHSTVVLLKERTRRYMREMGIQFTFYCSSIKGCVCMTYGWYYIYLHSTVVLLKAILIVNLIILLLVFTFYCSSIKGNKNTVISTYVFLIYILL